MFSQRSCYFSQLSRSHPILKLIDIYDRQSFIRVYVLDNFYVYILMYILFYVALWYANNIIKRIERSNREMSTIVAENKTKLDRLVLLKNKKAEFEDAIVKTTDAQKETTKYLEDEMNKLSTELITTSNKITGLEKVVEKYKYPDKLLSSTNAIEGECSKEFERITSPFEKFKILEPSFPPTVPPEPPPRKYGIFVSRPPGRRASSATAPATPPPKIRFK
ncbi:PREDICTED: uncharacterized protein LOC105618142 [Atta cephalotes]|uniref:Uncharacterized protein n=1 Tax=Atta cephalotes TaxID=12957 RepID=A0A158NC15_ATTCE|nr:PREDICTED: uncharacterized protein LOC105618142 [Atta cephalotes]XP_018050348.1 PREDICTED: uncharacterized protein LOC108688558 [Atta colombica]